MYDGGQKCWGLPSDISTTGYLTPPPSTMLNFDQNGWKLVFLGSNSCRAGECGYEGMNPKPIETLLLVTESYVTVTWRGFSTESQILLTYIVRFLKKRSQTICFTCVICRWQLQNTVYYPGGTDQSQDSLAGENGS